MTRTTFHPRATIIAADDPDHHAVTAPLVCERGTFLPATAAAVAMLRDRQDNEMVSLQLAGPGGMGLHAVLAPASARIFAESLLAVAGDVEARAADQTAAILRKAASS